MKTVFHPASERGTADHGWLQSHHSFSFASFYHPEKVHFGLLRVLNDDVVAAGRGFGRHPHENMEIITIPLFGALAHKDSTGGSEVITTGEVQIMHAGSGIQHSEMNASTSDPVGLFQIWIFPDKKNIEPSYEQKKFDWQTKANEWTEVVSPDGGSALWINQQAWINLSRVEAEKSIEYQSHSIDSGIYILVIEGELNVGDQVLSKRDALGIWEFEKLTMKANVETQILVIEIPMQ